MSNEPFELNDDSILAARPSRNQLDINRPYAFLTESEHAHNGQIEDVATVFLTNRECPFRCLMCDLWRYTTEESVPSGAIPTQIDYALERLPPAQHIKLYNSGNFFDARAIPRNDWPEIASRVRQFRSVIVENHPKLTGDSCLEFRDMLAAHDVQLEIAIGLETIHPVVLPRLNKNMTLDDFSRAVAFLVENNIRVRTFILLKPPFTTENEGIEWALKSVDFAFEKGVSCCAVIPTRTGNGIMEQLSDRGDFAPPKLSSLETVLDRSLPESRGRVFVDLWDAGRFAECSHCADVRIERLAEMNLSQTLKTRISCELCGDHG